jgi:multifunctional methyltransferase subunit TRM112
MKILTTNFLTCAVKSCKSSPASFPLHFKDAVLERSQIAFNPLFMNNILPRLNWDALRMTATELGLAAALPAENPSEMASWWKGKDVKNNGRGDNDAQQQEEGIGSGSAMEVESSGSVGGSGGGGGGGAAAAAAEVHAEADGKTVASGPEVGDATKEDEEVLKKLHGLLLETAVSEGKLVCGNCGFEYPIKDGVGNFLLPAHLV